MTLSMGEVSVSIPGFHPILLLRTWRYGRRTLRRLDAGELSVDDLVEELRKQGVKIKVAKS